MTALVWDNTGSRAYEFGIDKGVLYLSDGLAVCWNGLTSIVEHSDKESNPIYYDGNKINNIIIPGNFSASMKAITYPDEFLEVEGLGEVSSGFFVGEQKPKSFNLCYRTQTRSDDSSSGYKLHLLYNVTAIPADKQYVTLSDNPNISEFEWEINTVPIELSGYRPTSHIIINSNDLNPFLLDFIEQTLYGNSTQDPQFIPLSILLSFVTEYAEVKIFDNGDGTWTAYEFVPGHILFDPPPSSSVNPFILNEIFEGSGGWNVIAANEDLLLSNSDIDSDGYFKIINVNADYLDVGTFIVSDTA